MSLDEQGRRAEEPDEGRGLGALEGRGLTFGLLEEAPDTPTTLPGTTSITSLGNLWSQAGSHLMNSSL